MQIFLLALCLISLLVILAIPRHHTAFRALPTLYCIYSVIVHDSLFHSICLRPGSFKYTRPGQSAASPYVWFLSIQKLNKLVHIMNGNPRHTASDSFMLRFHNPGFLSKHAITYSMLGDICAWAETALMLHQQENIQRIAKTSFVFGKPVGRRPNTHIGEASGVAMSVKPPFSARIEQGSQGFGFEAKRFLSTLVFTPEGFTFRVVTIYAMTLGNPYHQEFNPNFFVFLKQFLESAPGFPT